MQRKNKEAKMTPKRNPSRNKLIVSFMGIFLFLFLLASNAGASRVDNRVDRPLSFSPIMNFHNLLNIDTMVYTCAASSTNASDKKTTPSSDTKDTKLKSGKKTVTDQKNSTSRRGANIKD